MNQRPNIIVVVLDTLRSADLNCYRSSAVQTRNLDAFASTAARFTQAYPESLPTIPVRRALHTGRRAFPFRDYNALKWDIVCLPGWQPMSNREDTLAETLAQNGYHTGLVTDTLPYFAPGMNFTRGFWQWEFIRGQQQDRWKSPHSVPAERLEKYATGSAERGDKYGLVPYHLANTAHVKSEEDTTTARVFQSAMNFIADNRAQPFYLMVDSFAPHEPWEAPEKYFKLYGDPAYSGRRIVHCHYGPADKLGYTKAEIEFVHAQYRALVSLVDAWFGKMMHSLQELGLEKNTAVIVVSDHGANFCDNPRNVVGKPDYALYPGVMQVPLMVRLPGAYAARVNSELVYSLDVPATVYDLAGVRSADGIHGQSLVPLASGNGGWRNRDYVTCRYGNYACCIDKKFWVICDLAGRPRDIFDLEADPHCQTNIVDRAGAEIGQRSWQRILDDAGGALPDYTTGVTTNAIGEQKQKSAR